MGIVLRGGTVVTADARFAADVRIEGESVAAVGVALEQSGDQIVDVAGCY